MTKEARLHNGEKTASAINGAGKIVGEKEHFLTSYTKKLKMDLRPKCKT